MCRLTELIFADVACFVSVLVALTTQGVTVDWHAKVVFSYFEVTISTLRRPFCSHSCSYLRYNITFQPT